MYQCVRCKKEFDGEPALENRAGKFCQDCRDFIFDKMRQGMQRRSAELNGVCLWCGDNITSSNVMAGRENEHVCKRCDKNREWVLKCIRISDRPAKYVARVEAKEAPDRIEREKRRERDKELTSAVVDSLPSEVEVRVKKMEDLLTRLANELGIY
jgi:DNA-directed RNA polymerase subunit RPC12/RpoP